MKKLLSFIALMFAFVAISSAQSVAMTGSGDSLSNTATKTVTTRVTGTPTAVSVSYVLTKSTGTPAGTAYLQGSADGGLTYVTIQTTDTLKVTNVTTNKKVWVVSSPKNYTHYRVTYTGVGTMKVYIAAYILVRKD